MMSRKIMCVFIYLVMLGFTFVSIGFVSMDEFSIVDGRSILKQIYFLRLKHYFPPFQANFSCL